MNDKFENCILNWVGAWIALIDNLTIIFTFGYIILGKEFNFICWRVLYQLNKQKQRRQENKL